MSPKSLANQCISNILVVMAEKYLWLLYRALIHLLELYSTTIYQLNSPVTPTSACRRLVTKSFHVGIA